MSKTEQPQFKNNYNRLFLTGIECAKHKHIDCFTCETRIKFFLQEIGLMEFVEGDSVNPTLLVPTNSLINLMNQEQIIIDEFVYWVWDGMKILYPKN